MSVDSSPHLLEVPWPRLLVFEWHGYDAGNWVTSAQPPFEVIEIVELKLVGTAH